MTADFRRIALGAALAIVSTILVAMSASAIFPSPDYRDRPKCEERLYLAPDSSERLTGNEKEACERQIKEFEQKEKTASKNQFFVLLGGSIALILIGGALFAIPVVSSGILWGGVASLFYTLISSFLPGMEDYNRLLAAGVAFVVLVILAYRLFGKERTKG